jgi:putative ABC transport system permease protein
MEIVGVVEDFHYESLHNDIDPLLLFHRSVRAPQYIAVRITDGDAAATVNAVRQTWQSFSDLPFAYSFLANDLAAQYESEAQLGRLFLGFAVLSILIASLGLFGLAAYATRQRTREVGIRKALGASSRSIIALLSRNFLLLVGLAFLLAAPVAYLAMDQWLQTFAYRIDIGAGLLAFAGGLAFLIAALTVSSQAWRTAHTNPAFALRGE